ncbi:MAG: O-antigen ligase family protein [Ilumatobacter sp.]|nr:O-antigen ligase family protein [Ilumatobacter sp.]
MLVLTTPRRRAVAPLRRLGAVRDVLVVFAALCFGTAVLVVSLRMAGPYFPLAFVVLVSLAGSILVKPIFGVYLTIFLTLVSDGPTIEWYPFALNFSSRQSILFLHDSLTISPIEIFLGLTMLAWFAHVAGAREWRLEGRPVLLPMVAFVFCLMVGMVWGLGIQGGDTTVAIWELRPLLYMPVMFFLVSNLFTRTVHYIRLSIVALAAISVQNVLALQHYLGLDPIQAEELEGLTEHAGSIHYDWLFVLLIAALTIKHCTSGFRFLVLLAAMPTFVTFVLSQRRAAVVALGAGVLLYFIVLLVRQRATFLKLFPVTVLAVAGYSVAFWNSSGGVGFGARAIKTVLSPEELSERDTNSNIYRLIENYNLVFTIRNNPLFGVGFGQPFDQPVTLPDISFFVFYEFIPHNSILWIWLKTGYLGFVTLLVIVAFTLRAGTRATLALPSGNLLAVTIAGLGYVVMFLVFAFVDIAWDSRSTLFLGACIALCANVVRLWESEHPDRSDGTASEHPVPVSTGS